MGKILSRMKSRQNILHKEFIFETISQESDSVEVIEEIDGFVMIEIIDRTEILNNDILIEILSNLPIKSLLQLERVSKQFQFCVNFVLNNITGIEGKQLIDNKCNDIRHNTELGNIDGIDKALEISEDSFITTNDRPILRRRMNALLMKCRNIRAVSLPFARTPVVKQFIEHIGPQVLNIECLRITFDANVMLTTTFFILMSTALRDKLLHLDVSLTYNNLLTKQAFYHFIQDLNALQSLTIRCPIDAINPVSVINSLEPNVRKLIFIFE